MSTAYSADGKTWHEIGKHPVAGSVKVGPVAFGCMDKEFAVTIDEYELNVGKKK